jgi:CBS domain-containing protein
MSVGRICSRVLATASPQETLRVAAERMAEFDVGTLVVLDASGNGHPAGLVTDRDIVTRCVAERLDPAATLVERAMSTPVRTVDEYEPTEAAVLQMAAAGTRRLVVTGEGGRVVGILSLDDVLARMAEQVEAIGRLVQEQRPSIPAV